MISFFIAAALLILAVTAILVWPLMRSNASTSTSTNSQKGLALSILREQRKDLDNEHHAGNISDESYAQTLAEIERRALDESAAPETHISTKPRLAWAIAVGVSLPMTAIAVYLILGNAEGLDPTKTVAQPQQQVSPEQIDAMVIKLAERVKANPNDLEGLHMLGRSYMVLQRFGEAAKVFAQLAEKQPQNAQVFADWADAAASVQDRQLAGEPAKLIEKALALDPQNIKALALSGTFAFERNDFKQAVAQWQKIAERIPAQSEFSQSVQAMIAEASKRGGITPAAPKTASASTLILKGRVTLSAALKAQVGANDSLFIFARPAAGGPPIAGMRFQASELPIDFDFSKAQMMMGSVGPQDKVIIGARVSKSGNAIAASGDLQGLSAATPSSSTKPVNIEISEQVK